MPASSSASGADGPTLVPAWISIAAPRRILWAMAKATGDASICSSGRVSNRVRFDRIRSKTSRTRFGSSAITDGEIKPMKANVSGSSSKDSRVVRVQSLIRSRAEPPLFRATTEAYIASRRSAISSKTVFCITALLSK